MLWHSGTGQFRRTKWVWMQWSGDEVGALARSRAVYGGAMEAFQRILAPYSLQLHAGRHEEVAPEVIIERYESHSTAPHRTASGTAAQHLAVLRCTAPSWQLQSELWSYLWRLVGVWAGAASSLSL